jgi:WD40 repeat protein
MARTTANSSDRLRLVWKAGLEDHVIGVSWSPDGKRLAAAVVSGPVTVFDATGGQVAHALPGHGFGAAAVAWQPNGNLLATAGQDGKVRIWDAAAGGEVAAMAGGAAWVETLAWHPAGSLLGAGAGKKVRVWDVAGNLVRELPPQAGTVMDLAWQPGTNHLTVLGYGAARLYDPAASDQLVRAFEWKGSPLRLAWSPDGQVLAHGNQDATVHFWYAATGADLQMYGYPTKVRELSWDFTSRYLATGGGSMPCVWDCQAGPKGPEGSKPQMLEGHEDVLSAVAWQHRGYLLAFTAADGRVIVWQPGNKKTPRIGQFRFETSAASTIAWSTDDRCLATGSAGGTVAIFRVN